MKYRILAVDDESFSLHALKKLLHMHDYEVDTVQTSDDAITLFRRNSEEYALVLLDYTLKGDSRTSTQLIKELLFINPEASIYILSGVKTTDTMDTTWKAGAIGYIEKGNDKELLKTINNQCRKFEETTRALKTIMLNKPDNAKLILSVLGLVGQSDSMAEVARLVLLYRPINKTKLIIGEKGSGKEQIARALHVDINKDFAPVNCASYKDASLLESDLFGYEKGAFTGADSTKIGLLERVKDGTVFFDEFHHLSLPAQSKLLRLFQDKVIRRVSGKEQSVNVNLIVACQPKLIQMVAAGSILDDIYDRINQLPIVIPPLRDRPEDIEPLIAHFTAKICKELSLSGRSFRMKTVRKLETYSWPGNVRELEHLVEKLIINCQGKYIEPDHLPAELFSEPQLLTWKELEEKHVREKKECLLKAMNGATGVKSRAANALGISPNTFHSLTIAHGLYQSEIERTPS
jgi:DNA-binding NtrC family response regulator